MKISKLLPVLCAFAVGVNGLTARAEDNPVQAAAREALAKKLFEIGDLADVSAKAANTNAASAPISAKDAKAKAKADKAAADAKAKQEADQAAAEKKAKEQADKRLAAEKAAQVQTDQAAAEARAKQAAAELKVKQEADKKFAEQQAAEAKANAKQAEVKTDTDKQEADKRLEAEKAALVAAMRQREAADAQAGNVSRTTTNQPAAKLKPVTKAKKEKKQKPAPAAQAAAATSAQPTNTVESNYAGKELGMKPIASPALPIAAGKAERLQALLTKYKADLISPEEYHQQRAAILAEP